MSKTKLSLTEFIARKGVRVIAEAAGVSEVAVRNWLDLRSVPSVENATMLIKLSLYELDFNAIYEPFQKEDKIRKLRRY